MYNDQFKLGIVIPTRNRPEYLLETIKKIYLNLSCNIEVVVVDGSTNDDTQLLLKSYNHFNNLKYYKQKENNGFDFDLNFGIIQSSAEFIWMFSDDDIVFGSDINKVYNEINLFQVDLDLLIINSIIYDKMLTKILQNKFVLLEDMSGNDLDTLFNNFVNYFSFFGGCIIKKNIWIESDAKKYFGSLFVHIGVIFGSNKVINWKFLSEPIIKIRYGNASWTNSYMKIWLVQWPILLNSFTFVDKKLRTNKTQFTYLQLLKKLVFIKSLGLYDRDIVNNIDVGIEVKKLQIIKLILNLIPKFVCRIISIIYSRINNKVLMLYDLKN